MTARSTRLEFRELLRPGAAAVLPGVANALAARVVADLGFPAAYVTGAASPTPISVSPTMGS
jgi:2-methylisocitrate lyase-like PEP mutase family enzyme